MDFQLDEKDRLLQRTARELAERKFAADAYSYEESGEYPRRAMKVLADQGMMGMTVGHHFNMPGKRGRTQTPKSGAIGSESVPGSVPSG